MSNFWQQIIQANCYQVESIKTSEDHHKYNNYKSDNSITCANFVPTISCNSNALICGCITGVQFSHRQNKCHMKFAAINWNYVNNWTIICDFIRENPDSTDNYNYLEITNLIIWSIITQEGKHMLAWNLPKFYSYLWSIYPPTIEWIASWISHHFK